MWQWSDDTDSIKPKWIIISLFTNISCVVYKIFLSQVKTVSATDGFDFGQIDEKVLC